MPQWSSRFIMNLRRKVSSTFAAVVFALSGVVPSAPVFAGQQGTGDGLLAEYCADPIGNIERLEKAIRARIGLLAGDASHDVIVLNVIDRISDICVKGTIPESAADQNARLNTIVRDKRVDEIRRPKAMEFQDELFQAAQSETTADEILEVVGKRATTRQQMIFGMLAEGMTQQEIADRMHVAIGTVHTEKSRIAELLKSELQLSDPPVRNFGRRATTTLPAPVTGRSATTAPISPPVEVGPSMTRVQSPMAAEVLAAIKGGAEVFPTGGGYAGPVMTISLPSTQVSTPPIDGDGIVMLPVPIVLKSNTRGEQEMVVTAIREIGDAGIGFRTFALYAFCKDEALETPGDLSRYSFKSEVSDRTVIDIVTRSDLRKPEVISSRLWQHFQRG